jgi:hypothetical protein
MGYYIRFFATGEATPTLPAIEAALKAVDPGYALADPQTGPAPAAMLTFGGEQYAQIDLETPPEPEELEELVGDIDGGGTPKKNRAAVKRVLREARTAVVVQVLSGSRGVEATLARLRPLWSWLFQHHGGLLHEDGEDYSDAQKPVLRVE